MSLEQIAEAIDRQVGTVMSRLYRGRRQLETKLRGLAIERGIIKGNAETDSDSEKVLDMNRFRRRREA